MSQMPVEILDTTLRDGSYVIDFQFTAQDTALITSLLEFAGIKWIEVAHGLGLGAARAGKGDQACSDEDYLNAAADSVTTSKFGAFFIPGIGTEDDIRLAADCGVDFIRIGVNVNEIDTAAPYLKLAKDLGLIAFSNLMKSYAVPPNEFAEIGLHAQEYGADYLCVVDSAGGMLPEDVRNHIEAASNKCSIPVCFHGHNNLSMAIANSLEAIDAGAAIVDTSLQGMGRSEGNAITEILVAILQQRGQCEDISVNALLDTSEAMIRPLLHNTGYSPMGVTYGRAKFHSSFIGTIMEVADRFNIDPRELILKVTEHDQVNAPLDLVEKVAQEIESPSLSPELHFSFSAPSPVQSDDIIRDAIARAREVKEKARKSTIPSVFNVVVSSFETAHVSPYVETRYGCAISNVMLTEADDLENILASIDPYVDYILLDSGSVEVAHPSPQNAQVLQYDDVTVWARATVTHLTQLLDNSLKDKTILLLGDPQLCETASNLLKSLGAETTTGHTLGPIDIDSVVALSPRTAVVDEALIDSLANPTLIFDAGIGSLSPDAIHAADQAGHRLVRIDFRPTLSATALELINMKNIVEKQMGRGEWDGVPVVAGGLIGNQGDIIVDDFTNPTRILGIADGSGGITPIDEQNDAIQKVRSAIIHRKLDPST